MSIARIIIILLAALALMSCTTGDANAWRLYAKANYLYGRIEGKAETHCAAPIPPDRADVCAEAANTKKAVNMIAPLVEGELSQAKPDWAQIMKYVDLVFSLAAKALL